MIPFPLIAQAQETAASGSLERLGVAGILVVAAYFLIRYFIGVVAEKDKALAELTKQFITVAERFATATEANTHAMGAMQESIERLTQNFRSTLGDAIVAGAHEAMRGAVEVVQQTRRIEGGGSPGRR